ncbi:MAG: hypothetical protein HYV09_30640 [Deltaproteobacteria bacterium]|nr:hypothetical protein [Deltaproteobacteria bacterium]
MEASRCRSSGSTAIAPRTPRGGRFGALVHAVRAAVPLDDSSPRSPHSPRRTTARSVPTTVKVPAACERVVRAIAHPILLRARLGARASCRRGANVAPRRDDGSVVDAAAIATGAKARGVLFSV